MRETVERRLRRAWALTSYDQALERLRRLAGDLEQPYPGAAASLREGMEETLTVIKLGITGKLKQTIESTNPCESMIECVRRTSRNVKNWSSGEMAMRWTAAGMLEAEKQFRRVKGHTELADLVVCLRNICRFEPPLAAAGGVLVASRGAATPRLLRSCPPSACDASRSPAICGTDH